MWTASSCLQATCLHLSADLTGLGPESTDFANADRAADIQYASAAGDIAGL